MAGIDIFFNLLGGVSLILDTLLYPVYFLIQRPLRILRRRNLVRSKLQYISDKEILAIATSTKRFPTTHHNVFQFVEDQMEKEKRRSCLGTREILEEVKTTNQDGEEEIRYIKNDHYKWEKYETVLREVAYISRGMNSLGFLHKKDKVVFYADTCKEWLISSMATLKNNYIVTYFVHDSGQQWDQIRYRTGFRKTDFHQSGFGSISNQFVEIFR